MVDKLKQRVREQEMEVFDLIAKVIEVIKDNSLWGEEGEYTFNNGEVWHRFDPEYDMAKSSCKLKEETNVKVQ